MTLVYKSGRGFNSMIEDEAGQLVAVIEAGAPDRDKYFGQLFAAAPDLLKACEAAMETLEGSGYDYLVFRLRYAIGRARGERPTRGPEGEP